MTPATNVTLYKSKLDISNRFVMYVTDANDARTQVTNLSTKFLYLNNCFWQRDNISIRAPYNIEQLREYNYCSYINGPSGNYIFAFITGLTYVNDDLTYINIKTDSWMTYSHRCNFLPSLMSRCHPEADEESDNYNYFTESISPLITPNNRRVEVEGKSLLYIKSQVDLLNLLNGDSKLADYPAVYTEWLLYTSVVVGGNAADYYTWWGNQTANGITIGGIPQGPTTALDNDAESLDAYTTFLKYLNACNLSDLIVSTYVVPAGLAGDSSGDLGGQDYEFVNKDVQTTLSMVGNVNWNKIYYAPQFHKLSYRFCGNSIELPFERLSAASLKSNNTVLSFKITSNWSEDGCAFIRPTIIGGDQFVIASPGWDKVSFNTFTGATLKSNTARFNEALDKVGRIGKMAASAAGAAVGMNAGSAAIGSALTDASNAYFNENNFLPIESGPYGSRAVRRATNATVGVSGALTAGALAFKSIEPITASEIPSSALVVGTTAGSLMGLLASQEMLSVCHEYPMDDSLKKLNDYFGMWGYDQGGLIHSINTNPGSLKFKYYKTVDCVLTGDCPQDGIEEIKGMFDAGVFIFKDASGYKNLDVANNHY